MVDNLQNNHRFEARTALTPSPSLNIDLNWNVSWSNQTETDIQRMTTPGPDTTGTDPPGTDPPGTNPPGTDPSSTDPSEGIERFETESGNASASVWAFGGYQDFIKKQLETFERALQSPEAVRDAQNTPLTKTSLEEDLREAYLLRGGTSIAGNGFVPFPLPGWTVRYSGLSDWPFIEAVTENVTLNHGYSAEYETGFNSISTAGDSTSITVAEQSFQHIESSFEPQSVQIQERFQPVIGVDVTWPFGLQTSFEWNQRTTTALRGTNVVERETEELSGRLSYSTRGLTIPFFTRVDNRLQFSLTFTRAINDEREFLVGKALQQAQDDPDSFDPSRAQEGDNLNLLTQTTRLTFTPKISYSVSNNVTANLQVEYEKFDGDNKQPSFTNVNGRFNLSVSISEN